jgi:hypothetical protein
MAIANRHSFKVTKSNPHDMIQTTSEIRSISHFFGGYNRKCLGRFIGGEVLLHAFLAFAFDTGKWLALLPHSALPLDMKLGDPSVNNKKKQTISAPARN